MRSYPEYPLQKDCILTVFWNRPDGALARIYHVVRDEDDPEGVHLEIGIVITWLEKADSEQAEHWRAECYLSEVHFSNEQEALRFECNRSHLGIRRWFKSTKCEPVHPRNNFFAAMTSLDCNCNCLSTKFSFPLGWNSVTVR